MTKRSNRPTKREQQKARAKGPLVVVEEVTEPVETNAEEEKSLPYRPIALDELTKVELLASAKSQGIEVSPRMTKAEIRAEIEAQIPLM